MMTATKQETLTERLHRLMADHGWTDEEMKRWKFDGSKTHPRCEIRPEVFVEDKERWMRMRIRLSELLPDGAKVTDPEGNSLTWSQGYFRNSEGVSQRLYLSQMFDLGGTQGYALTDDLTVTLPEGVE